ncbi:DUF898 domain-containing protein [Pseudoalteromonas sp. JBTF-M23]|uniref:DUF898 domain-containing protein n=1 Tax=Pseudoalteromonas caenipelagi TaxID=2726988 RepID=A0A849V9J5_9GAMM|nr:YjgN family protein [Pseudoalteromonas caenipelagi]NOU50022.1 DUF898 domain-containing protein [Pseudoalteromonas caenipelagi]
MDLQSVNHIENAAPKAQRHTVQFSGDAASYFSLWAVNILFTILTLGIYSAWATVRNKQYFYGHTSIDGHRFDYLATPIQILKGRILAAMCFTFYIVSSSYFPLIAALFLFIWMFAVPWVINQGLRFNLRMTRYRNVQFSFAGNYKDAFINFIVLPFLSIFTLYLAMPWVLKRIDTYIHNNIFYGDKKLTVQLTTSEYFRIAFACLFTVVGVAIVIGVFTVVLGSIDDLAQQPQLLGGIIVLFNFLMITVVAGMYQAMIRNHIFNNAQFEQVARFESNLATVDYVVLVFTNALAIVCSLGLALPWAKVRKAKMLAAATSVCVYPSAEHVINVQLESQSSFAEEAANVFDIDISLT